MPSHTFTRAGYWQDSIESNRAAAAAARRVGQTAEELHASDYQMYAYLQTGQDEDARKVLASLPEVKSRFDPKLLVSGAAPPAAGYFALAAIPARYALERRDWKAAAALEADTTPFPYIDALTWFARGLGAARSSDLAVANASLQALENSRKQLEGMNEGYWAEQVEIQRLEVDAWARLAAGQKETALATMKSAVQRESGTEKSAITPGPLAPARELLGEMLLELNEPSAALAEFEAGLMTEPNRFRTLYGAATAARLGGKDELSRKYFGELLKVCEKADQPGRPEILEAKRALSGN
jgi:tetratricopeptide (TPR) repeat protein